MKIENQVCTLEQSKKLNELGVMQGCSLFFFDSSLTDNKIRFNSYHKDGHYKNAQSCYSAFTVAELGIMLPRNFASFYCGYDIWRVANTFNYANGHDNFLDQLVYTGTSKTFICINENNEAKARAALLIHLVEKCHITVEEINQRLQSA
jgi:hypothetical protein